MNPTNFSKILRRTLTEAPKLSVVFARMCE